MLMEWVSKNWVSSTYPSQLRISTPWFPPRALLRWLPRTPLEALPLSFRPCCFQHIYPITTEELWGCNAHNNIQQPSYMVEILYIGVYRKLREKLGCDGNVYDSDSSHWYERPQVEKFLHKYRQAEKHIGWPAWGPSFPHISPESAMAAKWQRHVVDKSKHLHFGNLSYHFADFHFGHLP